MRAKLLSLSFIVAAPYVFGAVPQSIDSIYEPIKVATPPSDAYIGLSMLENGEIRHYNYGEQSVPGTVYLSSKDKGLTWKTEKYAKEMLFGDRRSPLSQEYLRLVNMGNMGVYAIRTDGGIDGNRTLTKVSDIASIMIKPPVWIRDGKRVVVAAHGGVDPKGCYTYVSDDDGLTWQRSNTVTTPPHEGGGFHQGIRWNHGAVEPTIVELLDGRLWMIMRTPQDYHYEAFSDDGGLTWSEPRPSQFYATITMPTIGRLDDGRLLFFWCNTTPLPELPTANGVWDDVFTNRDVTHVAISDDDGATWKGFRELYMDPMRNADDYALQGGGIDRGVHQAEFIEVEPGKILASIGQHPLHRAMMMFDVDWLYEDSRSNNFADSLNSWSTFNYLKGIKGHCAYNRINGVELVTTPEGDNMLHLKYIPDESLVADTRGAVWNFPAARKGTLTTEVIIPEGSKDVSLILNDRWMNPSDTVALYESMYVVPLDRKLLKINDSNPHTITLDWDVDAKKPNLAIKVDGRNRNINIPLNRKTVSGISYAHFIAPPTTDNDGIYIRSIRKD